MEGILYFISPLLYRKTVYFLRITASRPVGHVFVCLAHLQLMYHLDFIYNHKHIKKYIPHLISFLKKIMKIDAVVNEKKLNFMSAGNTLNFIMPSGNSGHYIHL